jgi:hypothetical protein
VSAPDIGGAPRRPRSRFPVARSLPQGRRSSLGFPIAGYALSTTQPRRRTGADRSAPWLCIAFGAPRLGPMGSSLVAFSRCSTARSRSPAKSRTKPPLNQTFAEPGFSAMARSTMATAARESCFRNAMSLARKERQTRKGKSYSTNLLWCSLKLPFEGCSKSKRFETPCKRLKLFKFYSNKYRRNSLNRPRPTIYPVRRLPLTSNADAERARKFFKIRLLRLTRRPEMS